MGDPTAPSDEELGRLRLLTRPIARFMSRWRAVIAARPMLNIVYRALITVIGSLVIVLGLILVPLPGPGWLIVFIGLTILGSEFHWARRLTSWVRMQLAKFWEWWRLYKIRKARRRVIAARAQRVSSS